MQFNSFHFLYFFPIVVLIYFVIPRKTRYIWLLFASYYFYMSWNPKFAILIATTTLITYSSGILLKHYKDKLEVTKKDDLIKRIKKIMKGTVAVSFITNLLILVFFKYFDFLLANLNNIFRTVGISTIEKPFDILLPIGISFYTFQALSYTVDVYRGDVEVERNILKYALFVSFFPQLTSGPIEKSKDFLWQIREAGKFKLWNYERITQGCITMLWGFFLKMVIADRVAILVNTIYDKYWLYGSTALLTATILYAVQIYCDFASYSNLAIGAAKIMGFSLMDNFDTPYFAVNIKDFWRRWHISLSTWFRDYLYIPLGGNRKGKVRKHINIMIVFLVSGLWHGSSWSFIVWGGLHGLYQIVGDLSKKTKLKVYDYFKVKTNSFSFKLGQVLCTFLLVDLAWIFFRANSFRNSIEILYRIIARPDWWVLFDGSIYSWGLEQKEFHVMIFGLVVLLLVDLVKYHSGEKIDIFLKEQCLWFRWGVLLILFVSCVVLGIYGSGYDASQFIYSQF